jgi:hypothetical protein
MGRAVAQVSLARPTPRGAEAVALSPRAGQFYGDVARPRDEPFKWPRIPRLVDLPEAARQARAEDRPILLWVAGDSPLQRC